MNSGFISIDWGSSNFRAYRVNALGDTVEHIDMPKGIARIEHGDIPRILDEVASNWPEEAQTIYCCGMISSTIGWQELPYLSCPISTEELVRSLSVLKIGDHLVNTSPGLRCISTFGKPDVMKGEEIQYLGFQRSRKQTDNKNAMVCMPGTHSKWMSVEDGRATHFSTAMTGDIFAALSASGLLKPHLGDPVAFTDAFIEGVEYARSGGALARLLFSVRSRVVSGELNNGDASAYASGILIGNEISDALSAYQEYRDGTAITLIGAKQMCELYRDALALFDQTSTILDASDACINGFKYVSEVRGNK